MPSAFSPRGLKKNQAPTIEPFRTGGGRGKKEGRMILAVQSRLPGIRNSYGRKKLDAVSSLEKCASNEAKSFRGVVKRGGKKRGESRSIT